MKLIPIVSSVLLSSIFITSGIAQDEELDLEIFTHPKSAVKAAKEADKQIAFVLYDETEEDHKQLLAVLMKELNEHQSDFVLVKCTSGREDFRNMFSNTFKQDISELPLVLLTDSTGKQIASAKGVELKTYADFIVNSLIATGDPHPIELADVRARIDQSLELVEKSTDTGEGFFGLTIETNQQRNAISSVRKWKKNDGSDFVGVLVAAKETYGEFIDKQGHSLEVKFNSLSQPDIRYLQSTIRK